MMLQSKADMEKSPDIADALCLAVGVPLTHPEARTNIRTKPTVITTHNRFQKKSLI
jgi:hypothetical protein